MRMERYVAFDIGDKRIGIAISDPFNTYALPSGTYFRKTFKDDIAGLARIASEKGATVIVCGLPVNFDGTPALQTEKTLRFIGELKKNVNIPVVTSVSLPAWLTKLLYPRVCAGKNAKTTSTRLPRLIFLTAFLQKTKIRSKPYERRA